MLAHRPSPATAIACLALFVALGGVSYGFATGSIDSREIKDGDVRTQDVRNNSVRTGDLRNNDVRGIDVRNGTIRGRDVAVDTITDDQVDESKLAQVPDAARLGGRPPSDFASSEVEAAHLVGGAGEPPFEGGATAAGAPDLPPGFWKDPLGTVHLQGTVTGATGVVFTLPVGYRPGGTARFLAAPAGVEVAVSASGAVDVAGASASLDGIAFRAG
jgi:hypothetical protein